MIGLTTALLLISSWTLHLAASLLFANTWSIPLTIAAQTFLHTGLFITAHDAIHGTVWPNRPKINLWVGSLAAVLYAFFPLGPLAQAHQRHHLQPTQLDDPDGPGDDPRFTRWYLRFVFRYLRLRQIVAFAVVFNLLEHGLGLPAERLLLFWIAPALLSTLQLFYFGTYLPHRPGADLHGPHHARSLAWAPWLSLLACFHFGYHQEHHASPQTPWWRLAALRRST